MLEPFHKPVYLVIDQGVVVIIKREQEFFETCDNVLTALKIFHWIIFDLKLGLVFRSI